MSDCEKLLDDFIKSGKKDEIFQITNIRTETKNAIIYTMSCHYNTEAFPIDNSEKLHKELSKLKTINIAYSRNSRDPPTKKIPDCYQTIKLSTYKKHPIISWFSWKE